MRYIGATWHNFSHFRLVGSIDLTPANLLGGSKQPILDGEVRRDDAKALHGLIVRQLAVNAYHIPDSHMEDEPVCRLSSVATITASNTTSRTVTITVR